MLCQAMLVGCTRRPDADAVTSGGRWLEADTVKVDGHGRSDTNRRQHLIAPCMAELNGRLMAIVELQESF